MHRSRSSSRIRPAPCARRGRRMAVVLEHHGHHRRSTLPAAQRDGFYRDSDRRARPDAAPDLLRADARQRSPVGAARPGGCRRRRRPDPALDPGHRRERPARPRPPLRQRRAVRQLRSHPVRGQARRFHSRRHAQLHARPGRRCRELQRHTAPLRAVPALTGTALADATAALGAAGFASAACSRPMQPSCRHGHRPGRPELALESSAIDLVVARSVASAETKLVFSVAGSKRSVAKTTTIAARIKVSRPASVTATLYTAKNQRLYTWRLRSRRARTWSSCGCRRRSGGRAHTSSRGSRAPARRRFVAPSS